MSEHIPTRITLTAKTGFTRDIARWLQWLSGDEDPRKVATQLLVKAIENTLDSLEVCDDAPRAN
jgi:hypothetical protein